MMPKKSLIKVIFSIIFVLALVITTVTISPRVASAENTSNSAIGALEAGIEFYEQGDLVNAESSYLEAIDIVLANQEVDVLIAAKQRLARIKENQGNMEEANKLKAEAEAGINALGQISDLSTRGCGDPCAEGLTCNGPLCKPVGSGPLAKCKRCGPGK